jgi:hypothetical protein
VSLVKPGGLIYIKSSVRGLPNSLLYEVEHVLTEQEVSRSWNQLLRGELSAEVFDKAETLLDELRPESPLRHRLTTELEEIRELSLQEK